MITDSSILAASLDRFANVLGESTVASTNLSAAVRASEKARTRRAGLLALTSAALLILLILGLIVMLSTARTQSAIKDCTDPAGTCTKRGAANTAKAVGNLIQSDLTVSYVVGRCQLGNPTLSIFDQCIDRDLAAARQGTLKVPNGS